MTISKIPSSHVSLLILGVAALILGACQSSTPSPKASPTLSELSIAPTSIAPTRLLAGVDQEVTPTQTSVPESDASVAEAERPTIEVLLADGTVKQIPAPLPSDYFDLLLTYVEAGLWDPVEGSVQLLRLIVGEIGPEAFDEPVDVANASGTSLLLYATDLLEDANTAADAANEIRRLISILSPSREVLEAVSRPAETTGSAQFFLTGASELQTVSCEDFQMRGWVYESGESLEVCFEFLSVPVGGVEFRVFYPVDWKDQEDLMAWVWQARDALEASMAAYGDLGDINYAHIVFGLNVGLKPLTPWTPTTPGVTTVPIGEGPLGTGLGGCAVRFWVLGGSSLSAVSYSLDQFKQVVAKELFHCFQYWNLVESGFSAGNMWWILGSSMYFSNVVYPTVDWEHAFINLFNTDSTTDSLFDMFYQNFAFFQHLANKLGSNQAVIQFLEDMPKGPGGGSETYLKGLSYMPGLFQDLFVTFASTGIPDTGGGVIKPADLAMTDKTDIAGEDDYKFMTKSFVGTRYTLTYDQEKRFVQSGQEKGDGNYSMVLKKEQEDRSAWSALPPEIRSSCQEKSPYVLVMTSLEDDYELSVNVSEVEKAECDPCLLGSWNIVPASFAEYANGLMEQAGSGNLELKVAGDYYLSFLEEGKMTSLRHDLAISVSYSVPGQDAQTVRTVTNAHGEGHYSADGEVLKVPDWLETTDSISAHLVESGISVSQGGGMMTADFFGQTTSGEFSSGPGPETSSEKGGSYVCGEQSLTITIPEGSVTWRRVEKIPPTPVPTPFAVPTQSP